MMTIAHARGMTIGGLAPATMTAARAHGMMTAAMMTAAQVPGTMMAGATTAVGVATMMTGTKGTPGVEAEGGMTAGAAHRATATGPRPLLAHALAVPLAEQRRRPR